MILHLSPSYSFAVDQDASKKRLIIFKDGAEFVCRKETLRKLIDFVKSDFAHLFKGRLQLIKTQSSIYFRVKGEVVGEMNEQRFRQFLDQP